MTRPVRERVWVLAHRVWCPQPPRRSDARRTVLHIDSSRRSAARSHERAAQTQYPAPRVLLADAHGDTRALYETWLLQHGFGVIQAATADETLEQAHTHAPDVIVTELMLPGGGPHVLDRLRADAATRDVVLIVLTTQNAVALREQSIDAGADIYLIKPCGAPRLGDVMASVSRARFERLAPRVDSDRSAFLRAAQRTFAIRERIHVGEAATTPFSWSTAD